jgi:hypothetical protein
MEQWELDLHWLKVQHFVKDKFKTNDLPKQDTILFIIGLQELGILKKNLSLEQKLDITTCGTCQVLSIEGYFERAGLDNDGWIIWEQKKSLDEFDDSQKERIIKLLIIKYFEDNYNIEEYEQMKH